MNKNMFAKTIGHVDIEGDKLQFEQVRQSILDEGGKILAENWVCKQITANLKGKVFEFVLCRDINTGRRYVRVL